MADQERKANLRFGVDSSGVKPGLDDIKSQVRDMATDVQQSGQRAAKGITAIGDGAPAAAQKVDTGARSLIGSIQRTTAAMEAGEKGTAKYYETLAKQRGVSGDTLKPYLDDLRKAEAAQKLASGSLGSMEMSAKATSAALRGVPAQFTDIITSLQGGQAPLTVFLQQGGQLKDMFGGAGNAARALGGYVLGLVNPFTIAAAAAGVLALAYNQGSKEADGYRNALILTGNAAGTTSAQLKSYAQDISGIVGTQGKAAESLTALAASGKVSADVLRDAGLAAVQYERATGQAVGKTAEQFASLRNDPLSAVLKLNEGMNFLTESTYRQIKSLEEQGRTADAARVAQEAYAQALSGRSGEIERNLGAIEGAWVKISDVAKKAWDNMLNVGRAETTIDKLKQVRLEIGTLEEQMRTGTGYASTAGGAAVGSGRGRSNSEAQAALKARIAALGAEAAALEGVAYAEKTAAEEAATRAEQMRGRAKWDKEGLKYLSEQEKLTRALTEAENEGRSLGASDAEIKKRQADIRAEFSKKATSANQSEIAGIRAKIIAEQEYIDRLRERGVAADKVTEGERLTAKIQQELEGKLDAKTRALKEQELVEAQRLATLNKVRASEEQRVKAIAESEAAYRKFLDGITKGAAATEQQAIQQEAANASFGKSKTAIAEMTLAQAQLAQSMAKDAGPWTPEYIAAMDEAVEAQRRWVRSLQDADFKAVNQHTDELLRNAKEMASLYEDESRLIGLSALERSKVVALRQVELKYAKELAKIDQMADGTAEQRAAKEAQRLKVLEAKQIESQAAVSKVIEEDWNKTSQLIGDTLADYIMGGGKDAAQYLKRLFATLVLQPTVQTAVGALIGPSGVASAVSGGSSLLGSSNPLSALSLVGGTFGAGMSAGLGGLTGSLGLTATGTTMGGSLSAGLIGLQSGNILGGLGTLVGALGPIVGGLGLLFGGDVFGSLFGRKLKDQGIEGTFGGETDFEGRTYQYYKGGLFRSNKTKYGELDEDLRSGLADQFGALQAGTSEMAKILGLGTSAIDDFTASIKVSFNGLDEAGIQEALKAEFQKIAESMASITLGTTEFSRAGETSVEAITRLAGSLSAVNQVMDTLGLTLLNASLAGGSAASSLVDAFGGIESFVSATGSFYENYYSEAERMETLSSQLSKTLAGFDLSIDPRLGEAAKEQFRAAATAALDAGDGKLAASLLAISGNFATAADYFEQLSQSAAEAASKAAEVARKAAEDARKAVIDAMSAAAAGYYAVVDRNAAEAGYVDDAQAAIDKMFGSVSAQAQAAAQAQASAAQAAAASWRSAASSIQSSLDKLRAESVTQMDPATRYALTKGEMDRYTVAALGGDADAASKVAGSVEAFLSASKDNSSSAAEYMRDRALAQAKLASVLDTSQAQASVQESIAAAANASVSELQALNANLTGFAGSLYELLSKGYQGSDRGTAEGVAQSFAKMQADYDAYFKDLSGFGAVGNKYTDASFNGAGFTKLDNNMAAFTGADGIVSYIRAGESLVEVAKRIPELRALWEKNYGIKLPAFDVGTNYIPYDMPAMVHKGERIIPAADNRALMSALQGQGGSSNAKLEAQLAQLLDDNRRQAGALIRLNGRVAKLLEQWNGDGTPPVREEVTA